MVTRPLFFSLLAGAAVAQLSGSSSKPCVNSTAISNTTAPGYGPTRPSQTPSHLAPYTLQTVTSVATPKPSTTPSSSIPARSSSRPFDDEQPAPYKSESLPASELFNPTNAAYFSLNIPTPCSALGIIKNGFPEYRVDPERSAQSGSLSTALAIKTPTSQVSSTSAASTKMPSSLPADSTSCTTGGPEAYKLSHNAEKPNDVPTLPESPPVPMGIKAPPLPPLSTGSGVSVLPAYPTSTGSPGSFSAVAPGFGWGRPRPTGFWPGRGYPQNTSGYGRGHGRKPIPSAGSLPENYHQVEAEQKGKDKGQAKSTPCTLETRVRPTATPPPRAH